ncbi:MAG: addiction module protein [Rhodanobacteraceae bacterium]
MRASLPLQDMSVEEKLRAMELLWADLSQHAEADLSPAWHGDELAARATALESGAETTEAWDAAKARIRSAHP